MINNTEEVWRPIFIDNIKSDYLISNKGNIYSLKNNMQLKPQISNCGYYRVELYYYKNDKYKSKKLSVHRLVALAFIENPNNKSQVNHIDGDKSNNCVENLEWNTPSENDYHAYANGLKPYKYGEASHLQKYSEKQVEKACQLMESGKYNIGEISIKTKIPLGMLYMIRRRHSWLNISYKYEIENCLNYSDKYTDLQIEHVFQLLEANELSIYDISDKTGVKYTTILNILDNNYKVDSFDFLYKTYSIDKYTDKPISKPLTDDDREYIHIKLNTGYKKHEVIKLMWETRQYNKDYIRHYIIRNF